MHCCLSSLASSHSYSREAHLLLSLTYITLSLSVAAKASPLDSKAVWEKAVREPIDRRLPGAMERLAVALKRGVWVCGWVKQAQSTPQRFGTKSQGSYY